MKRPNCDRVILLRLIGVIAMETRGYHGFGVFDKAVSSWFNNVFEEHGLTEDGKTVPPFLRLSVPNAHRPLQHKHPIV